VENEPIEKKHELPDLDIEVIGHKRYLVIREYGLVARERLPLHVMQMEDPAEKEWHMRELCIKLHRKMETLKRVARFRS
jgi:hypothetical protein